MKTWSIYENNSILGIPRRRFFSIVKKAQVFQKFPLEKKLHIVKLCLEEVQSTLTFAREFEVASDTIYT